MIVLTTFDLDEYVLAAIRAGASGFLLKDAPPEEMLAAIRRCTAATPSSRPRTRRLLEHLVTALPGGRRPADPDPRLAPLTDREREVLVRGRRRGVQHRDRRRPVRRRGDGEDPRRSDPGQARTSATGSGRRVRVRDRSGRDRGSRRRTTG